MKERESIQQVKIHEKKDRGATIIDADYQCQKEHKGEGRVSGLGRTRGRSWRSIAAG